MRSLPLPNIAAFVVVTPFVPLTVKLPLINTVLIKLTTPPNQPVFEILMLPPANILDKTLIFLVDNELYVTSLNLDNVVFV